jgi:hypothetical protein
MKSKKVKVGWIKITVWYPAIETYYETVIVNTPHNTYNEVVQHVGSISLEDNANILTKLTANAVDKYFPDMREGASDRNTNNRIYTPTWEKPSEKISLRPVYYPIPDGTRNISLTSIAGQWHNMGYGRDDIYRELLYVNSVACQPPLDINEIQCIVNSVTRYKR